jgi:hypothetical protein
VDDDGHQIGYLALPLGTPVHTSDGVLLGTVARVQDNAREHIFDGLVVKTSDGSVFVDAPEVARITTRRVTLTIDAAAARSLPTPQSMRGRLESGAKSSGRRWWRRLGR